MRCRFLYTKSTSRPTQLTFDSLVIIRESDPVGLSPISLKSLLDSTMGTDIYDPPLTDAAPGDVNVLKFPGRLTVAYPTVLNMNERCALTIQWEGDEMRYQCDRKFVALTGMVKTLELTEITSANAEAYGNLF